MEQAEVFLGDYILKVLSVTRIENSTVSDGPTKHRKEHKGPFRSKS